MLDMLEGFTDALDLVQAQISIPLLQSIHGVPCRSDTAGAGRWSLWLAELQ
jgi:hypothetical protein